MADRRGCVAALGIAGFVALGPAVATAHAAEPTSTRLTVPGDDGPTSGSWHGAALSGHPDPNGPPAPLCTPGQCDQEQLNIQAAEPDYATTHTLTCTIWITYKGGAQSIFDVALLYGDHHLIKAADHVASGQLLAVSGLPPDHYFVEVDSDTATQPTAYEGHAALSATPTTFESTLAPPPRFAAPPLAVPVSAAHAALPSFQPVQPTIGPGIDVPRESVDPPPPFGSTPIRSGEYAETSDHAPAVARYALFGALALALGWFVRRFRQAWRAAGDADRRS